MGEEAWLHFKSLEDSVLEIHLQSPVCIIVSQVPRWTRKTQNKEGFKEDSGEGELREPPPPDVLYLQETLAKAMERVVCPIRS